MNNLIKNEGVIFIAQAMSKLKNLSFLLIDLEFNDITDQGFIYLMQVISNL